VTAPTLRTERALLREHGGLLAAIDEVGRGALAGPVTVGIVLISLDTRTAPEGVRDSKLIPAARREALAPRIRRWAVDCAVGHATNDDIDAIGIIAALRLAARRGLDELTGRHRHPTHVLLDGSHNWLTPPALTLFDEDDWMPAPVTMKVKADLTCAAVAAASVIAKVERDAIMVDADQRFPGYGWSGNKGYAAPEHREALLGLGPSAFHRTSWNLSTGLAPDDVRDPQVLTAT
jgi:ribonuclease HII